MADIPEPGSATLAQVLVKLGEMSAQLAVITVQLGAIPDHESRLRALEKWRYSLPFAMLAGAEQPAVVIDPGPRHARLLRAGDKPRRSRPRGDDKRRRAAIPRHRRQTPSINHQTKRRVGRR